MPPDNEHIIDQEFDQESTPTVKPDTTKKEKYLTYACRKMHWSFPDPETPVHAERCPRCHYISYCPRCQSCWRISIGYCDGEFEPFDLSSKDSVSTDSVSTG